MKAIAIDPLVSQVAGGMIEWEATVPLVSQDAGGMIE
jgi:hypothetical protein